MGRTVLVVDDHPPFRAAARALLEAAGFDVIGEAEDAASALEACARLRPDVVLLDVQLPDDDGFAVARRLAAGPGPTVVLISGRAESSYRLRLRRSTALGFLNKSELTGQALVALLERER